MIRVVVVDDEPYLLRNIKESIQCANENFIVVGEAYDGEEALQIIEKTLPDVVFTDIKMPVVDGLELIEKIKVRKIKTIPVILSGYQEFEYAKKAIKFGVADYLLKPINPDTLKKLLGDLYNQLTNTKKDQQHNSIDLFINNPFNAKENTEIGKLFSEYSAFFCVYICSGPYCTYAFSQFTPSRDFWFRVNLDDILSEIIKNREDFWVIDGELGNEKIIIIGSNSPIANEFDDIVACLHNELELLDYPITTIYTPLNSINELPNSIKNLKTFMRINNVFGEASLKRFNPDANNYSNNKSQNFLHEKAFDLLAENRQVSQIKAEIKKLLQFCSEQKCLQLTLERLLRQVFQILSKRLNIQFSTEEKVDELISNSSSYMDIYDNVCFIVDDLFMSQKSQAEVIGHIESTIIKIDQYINNNFSSLISLNSIANMFGISQSYLSSYYKKYKGVSPIDQIINLKIEKAKTLLSVQPFISIRDISEAVGYDDQYYFSRIFKNVVGKSPSAFRDQMQE